MLQPSSCRRCDGRDCGCSDGCPSPSLVLLLLTQRTWTSGWGRPEQDGGQETPSVLEHEVASDVPSLAGRTLPVRRAGEKRPEVPTAGQGRAPVTPPCGPRVLPPPRGGRGPGRHSDGIWPQRDPGAVTREGVISYSASQNAAGSVGEKTAGSGGATGALLGAGPKAAVRGVGPRCCHSPPGGDKLWDRHVVAVSRARSPCRSPRSFTWKAASKLRFGNVAVDVCVQPWAGAEPGEVSLPVSPRDNTGAGQGGQMQLCGRDRVLPLLAAWRPPPARPLPGTQGGAAGSTRGPGPQPAGSGMSSSSHLRSLMTSLVGSK